MFGLLRFPLSQSSDGRQLAYAYGTLFAIKETTIRHLEKGKTKTLVIQPTRPVMFHDVYLQIVASLIFMSIFSFLGEPIAEMLLHKKTSVVGRRSPATNRSLILMPNGLLSLLTVGPEG